MLRLFALLAMARMMFPAKHRQQHLVTTWFIRHRRIRSSELDTSILSWKPTRNQGVVAILCNPEALEFIHLHSPSRFFFWHANKQALQQHSMLCTALICYCQSLEPTGHQGGSYPLSCHVARGHLPGNLPGFPCIRTGHHPSEIWGVESQSSKIHKYP